MMKSNLLHRCVLGAFFAIAPVSYVSAQTKAPAQPTAPAVTSQKSVDKPVEKAVDKLVDQSKVSEAVFPTSIPAEFANEKPGKARMHACSAQYKANKATNSNGGLKWNQKGGGYWSQCNKHLKAVKP